LRDNTLSNTYVRAWVESTPGNVVAGGLTTSDGVAMAGTRPGSESGTGLRLSDTIPESEVTDAMKKIDQAKTVLTAVEP